VVVLLVRIWDHLGGVHALQALNLVLHREHVNPLAFFLRHHVGASLVHQAARDPVDEVARAEIPSSLGLAEGVCLR